MTRISPYIDPTTGDFNLIRGSIENRNTLETLLYTRLITPRGSYMLDLNFGNPLINKSLSEDTQPYEVQRDVQLALRDMVTLGYVRDLTVTVPLNEFSASSVSVVIYVTDNFGNPPQRFTWSIIP